MRIFLILLLLPTIVSAQAIPHLMWPLNPRTLGMGQAYVAVADDPHTAHMNPAGIRSLSQISYDLSFDAATENQPSHYSAALCNPGTESGTTFGMSLWTQGLSDHTDATYYVIASGTCLELTQSSTLGMVMRFPYLHSHVDSIESRWETLADLSALQTLGGLRLGATMERAFGGAKDIVPRRLHAGAAFQSSGITMAYEWLGDETRDKLDFHWTASHWGIETIVGKYAALRGGYMAAEDTRVTFGGAFGLMNAGWRVEFGWSVPTDEPGYTHWSVGMGYRI